MKTVILCGGKGRRLDRETDFRPKPLIHIGERPILWHIMKIYSYQGFSDFILCLGYKGAMIKQYFFNFKEFSNDFFLDLKDGRKSIISDNGCLEAKIYFVDTGLESMTGARVARIKKYIGEDDDFFLTYGDGVADIDDLTPNYVPTLIRELSTFFILQSARRSVAEPGGLQLAAKAAGVI